jgi:hypothetical protein
MPNQFAVLQQFGWNRLPNVNSSPAGPHVAEGVAYPLGPFEVIELGRPIASYAMLVPYPAAPSPGYCIPVIRPSLSHVYPTSKFTGACGCPVNALSFGTNCSRCVATLPNVHQARASLGRKITQAMAGVLFDLTVSPEGKHDQLVIRYQPRRLIDAIWQRFAEEVAGMMACARCPAPKCGLWFLRSAGREDRDYCCHACQVRAWRTSGRRRG